MSSDQDPDARIAIDSDIPHSFKQEWRAESSTYQAKDVGSGKSGVQSMTEQTTRRILQYDSRRPSFLPKRHSVK